MEKIDPKLKIILAMVTWGTLGLFVRNIPLNSIEISFFRAFIGSLFLTIIIFVNRETINWKLLKENFLLLSLSGIALGINWAALFQAMKYTTISNATLSYYFAPIFIVVLTVIILKEKVTLKNFACIFVSILGLYLILKSGENGSNSGYNHLKGVAFGLLGAAFYAIVVILNKFVKKLSSLEVTISQLVISAIVLLPIVFKGGISSIRILDTKAWIFILILGVVHTGIAYLFYFPSIKDVKSQTIAIVSYLDPITAIIVSAIFLNEPMSGMQIVGGSLILISAYINEKQ